MIESISISALGKPGASNVNGADNNAPKVWDTGEAKRVNGVAVAKSKGTESIAQLYAGVSSSPKSNVLDQVDLSLESLLSVQSVNSNLGQPAKSPYAAAKQEEAENRHKTEQPDYVNTKIDA